MASTNPYTTAPPPPPAPPPYRYRRSIAGPLILILIGVLFMARNFGWHFPIWHWFGRWWPVVLIVWGVIILIENTTASRSGYRSRRIGGPGVFLLLVLIGLGVWAHNSSDIDWNGVKSQLQMDDDLGGFFGGNPYTFDDTLQQSFPAGGTLRIVSDRGALNITASDDDTIRVVVHKTVHADNQTDADKYNQGTRPEISVTGNAVLLNANTEGSGDHGVQSDMDIAVPAKAMIEVASKRGDVTIQDRESGVKVDVQHGDVSLTKIAGPAAVGLDHGSIRAAQVSGDVDVTGHVDSVDISDVSGAVRLNGDFYEDIRLSKIAGSVIFKTSRSDMEIASVPGDIEVASDEVRGNQLTGPTRVITNSKDIDLEDISGDLQVQSNNGDVEVTTGGNQGGKIGVTTQHGDVALTFGAKRPPEKVDIATQHGDVTLTVPTGAGFQINAGTQQGSISSDFGAVTVSETNGASHANGTVGNGSSKVQVSTDTGDIKLVKS